MSNHERLLRKYQSLLHTDKTKRANYKYIYEILSQFADAEYQVDNADTEAVTNTSPTTKKELLESIRHFLISEQNLKNVFAQFGKMHNSSQDWEVDMQFLAPYRFLGKFIKLAPLITDLFQKL